MNEHTTSTDDEQALDRRQRAAVSATAVLVVLAVLALLLSPAAAAGGAAAAQTNSTNNSTIDDVAPYYPGQPTVDNASWTQGNENASADSIVTYLSRLGTFVIGGDAQSGGAVATGMILLGGMLGAVVRSRVGLVGGGVLAVASVWGVVGVGLAPAWLTGVAMFGVGLLLSASLRRILT